MLTIIDRQRFDTEVRNLKIEVKDSMLKQAAYSDLSDQAFHFKRSRFDVITMTLSMTPFFSRRCLSDGKFASAPG